MGAGAAIQSVKSSNRTKNRDKAIKERRVNLESGRQGIREGFFDDMIFSLKFSGWEACKGSETK